MTRLITAVLASTVLLLVAAAPAALADDAGDGTVTVMVMKHACNEDVRSLEDFNEIKESADGPVAALAATVVACPTIVNPGDETSNGVKGEAASFSFTLEDEEGTHELPADTEPAKLCESDLGLDADGDGNISKDVCLDTTHYVFEGVVNGEVTVTETEPPAGFEFGELLFTPTEVNGNNDADSLVSIDRNAGVIRLDTTADDDGMIMLHIYNFEKQMPDTATAADTATENARLSGGLLLAFGLAAGVGLWFFGLWFARGRRPESASD
ncbi:MAG: hypothetical protein M3N29_01990 [Chloroflexota bacterium]|nr:hypothetical protein [Chloroflexota bacterium]